VRVLIAAPRARSGATCAWCCAGATSAEGMDAIVHLAEVEPEPDGLTRELDGGPYAGRLQHPRYD
jgi:hypothetical protein